MNQIQQFIRKKGVHISFQKYGIEALSAMAQGLFASLLIGTILTSMGDHLNIPLLSEIGGFASSVKGPAMAAAIGVALQAPQLVLYSLLAVGASADGLGNAGGPLAVYVVAIFSAEIGKLISKETKIDFILTPLVTIISGCLLSVWLAPAFGNAASSLGNIIMAATVFQPFIMGVLVSVIVGICLTLPISSAAICAALSLTGLAGGAALAGCCAQMVGFAIISYRVNGWSGLISQGLGTSMLQMGNIIKKPAIWISPIVTSVIVGPIATCVFQLTMNGPAVASGMGTCGLVGPIGVYTGWLNDISNHTMGSIQPWNWFGLIMICFILPGIISLIIHKACLKLKWYTEEDLKLSL